MGLKRYVIDHPNPFVVRVNHGGDDFRGQAIGDPLGTITGKLGFGVVDPFVVRCAHGDGKKGQPRWGKGHQDLADPLPTMTGSKDFALAVPYVAGVGGRAGQSPATSPATPLGTITAKNDRAWVTPFLTAQFGERPGQSPRSHQVDSPIPTVTPRDGGGFPLIAPTLMQYNQEKGGETRGQSVDTPINTVVASNRFGLVAPYLAKYYGKGDGQTVEEPAPTHTAENKQAIIAPHITKFFGGVIGQEADKPLPTVTAVDHNGLVAATIIRQNHGEKPADSLREPLRTVTTQYNKHTIAAGFLSKFYGTNIGSSADEPSPTATSGGQHIAAVQAFLTKYYGNGVGQAVDAPLGTITAADRFGLVEIKKVVYQIVDIGLRMLVPRELFRCQGFPDSYQIDITFKGKPLTKTAQVRLCGNSVCPPVSEALVRANFSLQVAGEDRKEAVHVG
jgi:DNA (cytosine-5)-methyltransferase 1